MSVPLHRSKRFYRYNFESGVDALFTHEIVTCVTLRGRLKNYCKIINSFSQRHGSGA